MVQSKTVKSSDLRLINWSRFLPVSTYCFHAFCCLAAKLRVMGTPSRDVTEHRMGEG